MFTLAWRNLTHERTRLAISVGGVALAVLLILVMSGLFAGAEQHAVVYMERQPADLWLMQAGVENIHMASSILSPEAVQRVAQSPGVEAAVGVLYASAGIEVQDTLIPTYLFGVASDAPFGGPWSMAAGSAELSVSQIVIDRALAARYDLAIGDQVSVMGYKLTIGGLSEETFGIATSIAFVNKTALAAAVGVSPQAASYVLVQATADQDLNQLAAALATSVPEANVMTRDAFIASEQDLIRQMGTDVILAMSSVAYVIGLLVIGLTIYTAVLEKARDYGVLKALGATTSRLVRVVVAQAFVAAGLGFLVGVGLAFTVASQITRVLPEMLILIEPARLLREVLILSVITVLAALLPLGRLVRLDPLIAFRA